MKEKIAKWFFSGMGAAGGITAAAVLSAAPGDAIYESSRERSAITAAQAACYAQCSVDDGAWDGAASDLVGLCVDFPRYRVEVRGHRTAPLADVPPGAQVVGTVQ